MEVRPFFDPATSTLSYLVWDSKTRDAVVIDPVMDFDPASCRVSYAHVESLEAVIAKEGLNLRWVLETHAHADHFSGAQHLKKKFPGAKLAAGSRICEVQATFRKIFNLGPSFFSDGRQFDRLFGDGEEVSAGSLKFQVIFTPGHTPACLSYYFPEGQIVFCGDTLFYPDLGTGRCDFPGGSATELFHSVKKKLYSLPETVQACAGHDYPPAGVSEYRWKCSIADQKRSNAHIRAETTESEYVAFRTSRDKTLSAPRLLYPSLLVNIDGGRLPVDAEGKAFLKLPLFS